jgi:hypothetical protein
MRLLTELGIEARIEDQHAVAVRSTSEARAAESQLCSSGDEVGHASPGASELDWQLAQPPTSTPSTKKYHAMRPTIRRVLGAARREVYATIFKGFGKKRRLV